MILILTFYFAFAQIFRFNSLTTGHTTKALGTPPGWAAGIQTDSKGRRLGAWEQGAPEPRLRAGAQAPGGSPAMVQLDAACRLRDLERCAAET